MRMRWMALLLLWLVLAGCSKAAAGGHLIPAAEGSEAYCAALQPFLPAYSLHGADDTLYAEVSRGHTAACFDVQAIPAMGARRWPVLVSPYTGHGGAGGGPHPDRCARHRLE